MRKKFLIAAVMAAAVIPGPAAAGHCPWKQSPVSGIDVESYFGPPAAPGEPVPSPGAVQCRLAGGSGSHDLPPGSQWIRLRLWTPHLARPIATTSFTGFGTDLPGAVAFQETPEIVTDPDTGAFIAYSYRSEMILVSRTQAGRVYVQVLQNIGTWQWPSWRETYSRPGISGFGP